MNELVPAVVAAVAPYLVEAGKKFAGKGGEAAFAQTARLWTAVKAKLSLVGKGADVEAFEAEPDDPDRQGGLRTSLRDLIKANPEIAEELRALLDAAKIAEPTVSQTITSSGHHNRNTIISGNNNRVG